MSEITAPQTCSNCQSNIEIEALFCSNCGYPENGTEKEKAVFFAKKAMDKNKHVDAGEKINSARNTLYVIAALSFVFGLIFYFSSKDILVLITNIILAVLYVALGLWSSKKPLMALLLGLVLYITTIVISAIVDPSTIISGILWKIIIISYLGKGIYSASALKNDNA